MRFNPHDPDRLGDAGIVYQNVHRTKIFDDLSSHPFALLFFGHVADVATVSLSDRDCDLRRVLKFQIHATPPSPALDKKLRGGNSDSLGGRRTRDDGYSIF